MNYNLHRGDNENVVEFLNWLFSLSAESEFIRNINEGDVHVLCWLITFVHVACQALPLSVLLTFHFTAPFSWLYFRNRSSVMALRFLSLKHEGRPTTRTRILFWIFWTFPDFLNFLGDIFAGVSLWSGEKSISGWCFYPQVSKEFTQNSAGSSLLPGR